MKNILAIGCVGVLLSMSANADERSRENGWEYWESTDFSANIVAGAIDVYAIGGQGATRLPGSPFKVPQSGPNPLSAYALALDEEHRALYVLSGVTGRGAVSSPLELTGYGITRRGLVLQWSAEVSPSLNAEVFYSSLTYPSVKVQGQGVVVTYAEDNSSPFLAAVYSPSGQGVLGVVGAYGAAQRLKLKLSPNGQTYYVCDLTDTYPGKMYPVLSAYRLPRDAFEEGAVPPFASPKLLFTSKDVGVVASLCR